MISQSKNKSSIQRTVSSPPRCSSRSSISLAAISMERLWSFLPFGIFARAALASWVFPRLARRYTFFNLDLSSAAFFSRVVVLAVAVGAGEDNVEAGEAAKKCDVGGPPPLRSSPSSSTRSRMARMPLCMTLIASFASSFRFRSETRDFISSRTLTRASERNSIVHCWSVMNWTTSWIAASCSGCSFLMSSRIATCFSNSVLDATDVRVECAIPTCRDG
mmetsp:Transcript_33979/g.45925  ORF Transcript_33979/g.45925 Transcript_33979/m.45925 type:complete len:219 (-) Transcript_33979:602-1258(-)